MAHLTHFHRTIVGLLVLFALGACGTTCQQIQQQRTRFLAREGADNQPHLSLDLAFPVLDALLAEHVGELPDIPVPDPVGGALKRHLGPIKLVPRALALRPAPDGFVGLRLHLAVDVDGASPVDVVADLHLRPQVEDEGRRLVLTLRGEDLSDVRPRITEDGAKRLAEALRRKVPRAARALISTHAFRSAANRIIDLAVDRTYAAFREGALRRLGRVTQIAISLPDLPLAQVRISSVGGSEGVLRVGIVTTLPVRRGLRPSGQPCPFAGAAAVLRVSGSTVTELANWAIAKGHIPAHYDEKGRADTAGPFEAALVWREGSRPFEVQVWRLTEPCLWARLAGTPHLRVRADELVAGVDDMKLEEVRGPALYELGAHFYALFGPTFAFTRATANAFRVEVGGGKALVWTLTDASVTDGDVVLRSQAKGL